jgi:PAS domain S-box-containing protein
MSFTASQDELLRILAQHAQDYAVFFVDPEGLVAGWTEGAARLLGYSATEIVGKPVAPFFPDERRPHAAAQGMEQARAAGRADFECWQLRGDGSRFWSGADVLPLWTDDRTLRGFAFTVRDQTQRKRAEQLHHEAEARKLALLETALDAIITIDHQDLITEFNLAAVQLLGYEREEVLGRKMGDVLVPVRLRDQHYEGMAKYLATGAGPVLGKRLTLPVLRADGTEFPAEVAIMRVPGGGPPTFTGYIRDITERVLHERRQVVHLALTQVLAEANSMQDAAASVLQTICEHLDWQVGSLWIVEQAASPGQPEVVRCLEIWHESNTSFAEFADCTRRRTFVSGEGLPGRVWSTGEPIWAPDLSVYPNFPRLQAAARSGLTAAFAVPVLLGADVLGVMEFFSTAQRPPDADLLRMMTSLGGQIGQFLKRKRAEEHLRESEQRFRGLMEQAPFSIQVLAPNGRTLRVNAAWEELWGATLDHIGNYNVLEDPQLEANGITSYLRQAFTGSATRIPAIQYNPAIMLPEVFQHDASRWVSAVAYPLKDSAGNVREVVLVHDDITERRAAEGALQERTKELAQANQALLEANRRKDEFLATLAHELRNPLAPIHNGLQILKMPGVDPVTVERSLEMMERQVHHMVRLVDDLLDVSRVMRGKIELRKERVDLATVIARAVETAQPLIDAQRHDLIISLPPQPLLVEADAVRMAQIIGNLLTNAAKYTEPSGRIWLTAERHDGHASLHVRDSGIGIAPEMLPHIFELFVQVDHAADRSQGGLGIGLTLVRSLVEMHGGAVQARSEGLGHGSEFIVSLPLVDDPHETAGGGGDDSPQLAPAPQHRLLVVDDNRDAAVSLAMLLRLQGHHVRVAHDGAAALEIARTFRPHMILLDLGMPVMDGYEVARQIRQHAELVHVALVALTGWGTGEDRRRSAAAGFNHHLVKPVDLATLEGLLGNLPVAP